MHLAAGTLHLPLANDDPPTLLLLDMPALLEVVLLPLAHTEVGTLIDQVPVQYSQEARSILPILLSTTGFLIVTGRPNLGGPSSIL